MKKVKAYHDGIVRPDLQGNHPKRVDSMTSLARLYDIGRKPLDTKLSRKEKIVKLDQSIKIEGRLVGIGKPLDVRNPLDGLNRNPGNCKKEFMEVPKESKTITREWNVLYTSQIMKKAKTYHDGILRVDVRGNHSKQVILYDIDRKQLDKKLIKKDEIVECGQSFKFDGHLVEIGDPLEDSNFLDALNSSHGNCMKEFVEVPQGSTTTAEFKMSMTQKYQALPNNENKCTQEWNVLYTSQIMKKAKTYHDGILRLDVQGNHSNQVILYDVDRKPLDKKLLKKDELIECGQSFKFDGHLVEIGEHLEASNFLDGLNSRHGNCMKEFVEVPKEPQHGAWIDGHINSDFSAGEYVEGNLNCLKPVRSVCQILQSLKKPMDMDSGAATEDAIIIQHDGQVFNDTVEKIVEQEYVPVKTDFETLSHTRKVGDDNVDFKAANPMEINIRTTECARGDGIDAMVLIRQTSPTSIEPGHEDSIFKDSGDCCKPDLGSPSELGPHLNENSENIGDCPSFNLLF